MMIPIINKICYILKMFLLLICFIFSFYIVINMYQRLNKNIINALLGFIPYFLLFILFSINLIFHQKSVKDCVFYNITCCLVFSTMLFAVYRTFNDTGMIALTRLGYKMNFNYYADIMAPIRMMLYMLCVSNVLLMFDRTKSEKNKG